jgi:phosphoglycolate phosphatase-like HAD superfamily hydrolase
MATSTNAPRVVVFDFDGVILESGDIKTEAFVELFAEHTDHIHEIRRHHLDNLGVSRFRKFEHIYKNILKRPLDDEEKKRLGERFSRIVFEKVLAAPFVGGAREALEALRVKDVPMIVASGTPQDELDRIVDERGLRALFVEVWGSPNEKAEVLRGVMKRFACGCDEILFVGDGTTDHEAATAAGVRFLARETSELADYWKRVGATRVPDLTTLPSYVR